MKDVFLSLYGISSIFLAQNCERKCQVCISPKRLTNYYFISEDNYNNATTHLKGLKLNIFFQRRSVSAHSFAIKEFMYYIRIYSNIFLLTNKLLTKLNSRNVRLRFKSTVMPLNFIHPEGCHKPKKV